MSSGVTGSGINSGTMRRSNRRLVLDTVRKREQVSRKRLADITGLTPASVTLLVRQLLAEGYLVERGREQSSNVGPRPIRLEINPGWGTVAGVELTATHVLTVLTDFTAQVLSRRATPYAVEQGPEAAVDLIIGEIHAAISTAAVPPDTVRGVGVVSAGPFDLDSGVMVDPPNFPAWGTTPIRRMVADGLGVPTWFDKETQAAAYGEYWFGDAGHPAVLFACNVLEVGIGGGLMVAGEPFRGHGNSAANIGHSKVALDGPRCRCGERGCLETVADGQAAVGAVRSAFAEHPTDFGPWITDADQITFEAVMAGAEAGQPDCRAAVAACARAVGLALTNVVRLIAPDAIVLCGDVVEASPYFVAECQRCVAQPLGGGDPVRVYRTALGSHVAALGGVALALDRMGTD